MKASRLQILKIGTLLLTVPFTLAVAGCDFGGGQAELTVRIQSKAEIEVGETFALTYLVSDDEAELIWRSGMTSCATVDGGVVTGISEGSTEITLIAGKGKQTALAKCALTVVEKQPVKTLVMSPQSLELSLGDTLQLVASSSEEGTVVWASSKPEIATVADGLVTSVSIGTTTITASTQTATVSCELTVTAGSSVDGSATEDTSKAGYTLVWSDEFNGTSLNMGKWSYQTGVKDFWSEDAPGLWGNEELEYYTEDSVSVSGGSLVITATKQNMDNGRTFKSGRILSRRKGFWTYGYFEAKIKTPAIDGMWPAFWMLPEPTAEGSLANKYGTWASNGEIDIMEAKGRLRNVVDTTLHFGNYNSSDYETMQTTLSSNTDEWHVYAVEWSENKIEWFVDGRSVMSVSSSRWWSAAATASATAPFDQPFYLILNLAVGGRYDNKTEPPTGFSSASMYVDYVRVYKAN